MKLGNGVLTMDGGDAVFSGGIYASNLRDYVQSGNIGNNAVTSPKIRNSSITKEKLEDAIKAVLADLENLYAEVMTSKLMSLKYMYYAGATTSNAFYGVKWKYDSSIGYYLGR